MGQALPGRDGPLWASLGPCGRPWALVRQALLARLGPYRPWSGDRSYWFQTEVQIGQYDGIITISGDGLIHEAVNGAMSR